MLTVFLFYGGLGMLALRIALAAIFFAHGWRKLKDLRQTAQGFNAMGFKPGAFWGTLVALLEFFGGGVGLLLGIFTQYIALLLAAQFVVIIIWKIARKQPFMMDAHAWELDIVILGALLVLAANGGGRYSLDRVFFLGW